MSDKKIEVWDLLQKRITWNQLNFIYDKRILDFGSGNGMTANHFAEDNEVIAIEPDEDVLNDRFADNEYTQIKGDIEYLKNFEAESFDIILCHNVFEYAEEREEIIKEFSRVLKKGGYLSVLKHNRAGRVMQMVVLLNNFEHANELLSGGNGNAQRFGNIRYYEVSELLKWANNFEVNKILGIRTFWHLQQNQEIQKDKKWQEQMLKIELKVCELEEYKAVSMLHHVILRKM